MLKEHPLLFSIFRKAIGQKVQYTKFQTVGNGIGNIVYVWRITPDGKVNLQSVSSTADIATWMVDYLMWTV